MDKLPGAQRRKVAKAAEDNPPWQDVLNQIEAYVKEHEPDVKPEFQLHDDSKEARR